MPIKWYVCRIISQNWGMGIYHLRMNRKSLHTLEKTLLKKSVLLRSALMKFCFVIYVLSSIACTMLYEPHKKFPFRTKMLFDLASRRRLFTGVETGDLRVLLNKAARWGLVRHLFLKLDTLMYLSSFSVVHRGLSLFLFWLETFCAVLWRE